MKCEKSKVKGLRRASSTAREDPGRGGVQEPNEGFMMSSFLLNASENLYR